MFGWSIFSCLVRTYHIPLPRVQLCSFEIVVVWITCESSWPDDLKACCFNHLLLFPCHSPAFGKVCKKILILFQTRHICMLSPPADVGFLPLSATTSVTACPIQDDHETRGKIRNFIMPRSSRETFILNLYILLKKVLWTVPPRGKGWLGAWDGFWRWQRELLERPHVLQTD